MKESIVFFRLTDSLQKCHVARMSRCKNTTVDCIPLHTFAYRCIPLYPLVAYRCIPLHTIVYRRIPSYTIVYRRIPSYTVPPPMENDRTPSEGIMYPTEGISH